MTVRVYVVVFDNPPPDPVIVTVYVPAGVELLVIMVIVDVALGLLGLIITNDGVKSADAPLGRPEAERLTVMDELYPPVSVTVISDETFPPCWTEPLDGLTLIENV